MSKCPNCGIEYNSDEAFCPECDIEGYHFCESCGKPIKESIYSKKIGGLVCKECYQKENEL
ncbi:protein of unknown function [Ruminococcaceae bacterium BL-6]|nr:protein of unknown function [Ruminococcaceae bacterium BL-6]